MHEEGDCGPYLRHDGGPGRTLELERENLGPEHGPAFAIALAMSLSITPEREAMD